MGYAFVQNEEKVEALVQLAATVAHELNNIFTAVSGNLSLLEDSFDHQSPSKKVVGDVIQTARRGIELSEKLQAFAGRQKLNRTTVRPEPGRRIHFQRPEAYDLAAH